MPDAEIYPWKRERGKRRGYPGLLRRGLDGDPRGRVLVGLLQRRALVGHAEEYRFPIRLGERRYHEYRRRRDRLSHRRCKVRWRHRLRTFVEVGIGWRGRHDQHRNRRWA